MAISDKFCLRWNDFQKNVSSSFQEIREDFCDVTLVGEGNHKIMTNKFILAVSSNFFRAILKENEHPHPLIYLKGIKWKHLSSVVDFMYHGEVDIFQEDLNEFLTVAEDLQLKGLEGNATENKDTDQEPDLRQPRKKSMPQAPLIDDASVEDSHFENWPDYEAKVEIAGSELDNNRAMVAVHTSENKISTTNEGLDERISSMMSRSDGQWSCKMCGKADRSKWVITFHIEAKHIDGVSHPCNQCGKLFRSKHISCNHKLI